MSWKFWLCLAVCLPSAIAPLLLAADERVAEPKEADQKKAEKQVREVYKTDYDRPTPEKQKSLALKLLQKAPEEKENPPARFVLLREARDLALMAGDGITALRAVDEMAKVFKIDAVSMKRSSVSSAAKNARTPEAARGVAAMCLVLAREAAAADDDEWIKKMLATGAAASASAKDPALTETFRDLNAEAAEMDKKHRALKAAEKTLKEKPEDPAASLSVGKFLITFRDDWPRGLRLLTHGSDLELVRLAEEDLAAPVDPQGQLDLGTGWFKIAEKSTGAEKLALKLRGARWHAQACAKLEGLNHEKYMKGILSFLPEIPFTRLCWEGIDAPPGLVTVRYNGKDQRGWTPLSGLWKFSGQMGCDEGDGKDRHVISTLAANWMRIVFEFKAGNPGLTFPNTKSEVTTGGVNMDNEARWNYFKAAIDMAKWHALRMERVKDQMQVYFDDKQYKDLSLDGATFILVKAVRGELRVRNLVAIGYNP